MLKTAFVAARDRQRLGEIASVLIGFGVTKVVERLGLAQVARLAKRRTPQVDIARLSQPQRVRRAIETLGPTFVKLGQILASRPDLLTPEWTEELEKLHSQVKPVPWALIGPQLEADLGAPPGRVFATVTLPLIAPALAAAFLLAFTLSLDDLVIASFVSGPGATTLPMRLYSQVRLGVNPEINAASTLLVGTVTTLVLAASWLTGRRNVA